MRRSYVKRYQSLLKNEVDLEYSKFIQMIQSSWERRSEWEICYQQGLIIRGNHTNNNAKMGTRIIKEQVFHMSEGVQFGTNVSFPNCNT